MGEARVCLIRADETCVGDGDCGGKYAWHFADTNAVPISARTTTPGPLPRVSALVLAERCTDTSMSCGAREDKSLRCECTCTCCPQPCRGAETQDGRLGGWLL
eukprot:13125280-Alexandrium_andersonii.AAC.1